MTNVLVDRITVYKAETFRTRPGNRLSSPEQAVEFANQRGFIFFWPIKGILLPSLWAAVAGDRPVPDEHDDPGHVTWDWKDGLLGKRRWYYGRVLRKRNTIISLPTAPYFYALTENFGAPDEDYLLQYEQGRLTQEAKSVYEALLREGPLDTVALRKAARLTSRESNGRFDKALGNLQVDFKILPVGIAKAGAWHYAFIYDLVPRHFPDIPEQARLISEKTARIKLAELYLRSVGAFRREDVQRLFGWSADLAQQIIQELELRGLAKTGFELEKLTGSWIILTELAS